VALKRPHPHVLDDARQRATLLREAKVAASLHHPNIVQVREVEEVGHELQLVMDYVEGTDLGTLVASSAEAGGRIPVAIAIRIVLDATAGLAALHEQRDTEDRVLGLVHRDVSPQNILVGVDGVARLTDFGLAKAAYDGVPSTTQGTLKGKLGYMAPEYVSTGQVDPGVDVFAMGVVLWEALAGRRLFRGENEGQTLDRVLHQPAASLGTVAPELVAYDAVLSRALAKKPAERLGSARALLEEIERVASGSGRVATREEVGAYVARAASVELEGRRERVSQVLTARRRKRVMRPGGAVLASSAFLFAAWAIFGRGHAAPSPAGSDVPRAADDPAPTPPAESARVVDVATDANVPRERSADEPSAAPAPASAAPVPRRPLVPKDPRALPPNPYVRKNPGH
jgi:hypothetical protein